MNHPPQLPVAVCPKCDRQIVQEEIHNTKMQMMSVDGEPGEVWEHRPKGGCGKWLWRRKKEAA